MLSLDIAARVDRVAMMSLRKTYFVRRRDVRSRWVVVTLFVAATPCYVSGQTTNGRGS